MKTFPVSVAVELHLTPADIRRAAGPDIMSAARQAVAEENRLAIAGEARRSQVGAYTVAARSVSSALDRYEAGVGTRDEKPALARLVAACSGLRAALKSIDKTTGKGI